MIKVGYTTERFQSFQEIYSRRLNESAAVLAIHLRLLQEPEHINLYELINISPKNSSDGNSYITCEGNLKPP